MSGYDDVIDLEQKASSKSYVMAVCLAAIFGTIGIHHFYLERWGMGLFDFFLFVISVTLMFTGHLLIGGILIAADVIHSVLVTYKLLTGSYKDGDGKVVPYPGQKVV